jgi:hypothetical protein
LINWFFSRQASKDLRREANNLRRLNGLTIRILEQANLLPVHVEATKDEAGEYTGGLTYKATATSQAWISSHATPTVRRNSDEDDQESDTREEPQQQEEE